MANSKRQKADSQKPAQTFRSGSVQAAVWQNIGENGPFYSTVLSRSFRDATGKWRTSTTFGERQFADLMTVATAARQWMADRPSVAAIELKILEPAAPGSSGAAGVQ